MPGSTPPKVVVLLQSADAAARLRHALEPTPNAAEKPGVLVTDLPAEQAAQGLAAEYGADVSLASLGVLTIAPADWGDAALPADRTPRELALACELVAKIAQLRRERDELARARHEVTQLAETDPLTGLPNRRAWDRALATLGVRQAQAEHPCWLALVDLDDFKSVNDRRGMPHGDRVLVSAGKSLAGAVRSDDLVARLGGDEFGVLLAGVSERHVRRIIERLRTAVAERSGVTASIGYRRLSHDEGFASAFAEVETAMREAKRAGGNQAVAAS